MMYEALTGELPIVAQSRRELLDLHQRQIPPPMLSVGRISLPEALDVAVMKCLKKRLNERPKSAAQLEQWLAAIPVDELPRAYPPETIRRVVAGRNCEPQARPSQVPQQPRPLAANASDPASPTRHATTKRFRPGSARELRVPFP